MFARLPRAALWLQLVLALAAFACGEDTAIDEFELEIDCPDSAKPPATAFPMVARVNEAMVFVRWRVTSTTTPFTLDNGTGPVTSMNNNGTHIASVVEEAAQDPSQPDLYFSHITITASGVGTLEVFVTDDNDLNDFCTVQVGSGSYVATDIHADVAAAIGSSAPHGKRPLLVGESRAMGANDAGEVVGRIETGSGYRAFLWKNGMVTDLGPGAANAISSDGWITGYRPVTISRPPEPDFEVNHAFRWQPNVPNGMTGTFEDLGTLVDPAIDPFARSFGTDINDNHQVVGTSGAEIGEQAFITGPSGLVNLGARAGGTSSYGEAINSRGDATGEVFGTGLQAALWPAAGGFLDLHDETLVLESFATDINDSGLVVISATTIQGTREGFVWRSGSPVARLVIQGTNLSVSPRAINLAGGIVAEDNHELLGFLATAPAAGRGLTITNITGEVLRFVANDLTNGGLIAGHLERPSGPEAVLLTPQ